MRNKALTFIFCLIVATFMKLHCVEAQQTSKEDCFVLFQEIIEKQNLRRAYQLGYEEMLHRHTNGEISKEKYEVFRNVWFIKENELKSEVTALYDVAYAGGCFDYKK
tara:strand:+ start:35 stop:355 length:321 start_codon:yes stop_codon:yes gene_type:complete